MSRKGIGKKVLGATIVTATVLAVTVLTPFAGGQSLITAIHPNSGESGGNVLTVDSDGDGDYTSIQEAIDAADPGDTILVYSGYYQENVRVYKQLTLKGIEEDEEGLPIVDASENHGSAVHITADGCTISGFKVINGGEFDDGILLTRSDGSTISNNIINGNEGGIVLYCSNNNNISGNVISNNDWGIYVDRSDNNVISANDINANIEYGLFLTEGYTFPFQDTARHNIIKHNNFIDNNQHASFDYASIHFFTYNTWYQNYWDDCSRAILNPIRGEIVSLSIPWIDFDWYPLSEPYEG